MNIDELVEKLRTAVLAWDNEWSMNGDGPDIRDAMLPILTEQAETHALELRAYEATVQNLEQRIRQLEAQSVAVVGEPVAWMWSTPTNRGLTWTNCTPPDEDIATSRPLYLAPTHSIPAADLDALRKDARLEHELETERMRLAACGVIAMANTVDSAAKARDMLPEYWSASAQDCASAVDREMDYRSRLVVAERERDELRKDAARYQFIRALENDAVAVQLVKSECDVDLDDAIDAAIAQEKGE